MVVNFRRSLKTVGQMAGLDCTRFVRKVRRYFGYQKK